MKYRIKFYGVICEAEISDDNFELIGKSKLSQKVLDYYTLLIWFFLRIQNSFSHKEERMFRVKILEKLE